VSRDLGQLLAVFGAAEIGRIADLDELSSGAAEDGSIVAGLIAPERDHQHECGGEQDEAGCASHVWPPVVGPAIVTAPR
jgi:hypothetical protein